MKNEKKQEIESRLIKIFSTIFKLKNRKKILNLKSKEFYNWDSLNHIKLIIYIEKEFNLKFGPKTFKEVDSFNKLKKFLIKK